MFFDLALALICFICFLISAQKAMFARSAPQHVVSFLFCLSFAVIGIAICLTGIFGENTAVSKEDISATDNYDAVTTAILSYYVPLGATISDDYYLEITEDDKYKFCYFEPDGATITRVQIPAYDNNVEIIASNDDLPHRVEFCARGDKIVAIKLHIPDDANAIQFDADGK